MALAGAFIFNQAKPEQWCIIWLKLKRQYDQAWATKQLKVKRQIAQVKRPHLAENPHCNTKSPAKQNKPLVAAPTINAQVSWAHVLQQQKTHLQIHVNHFVNNTPEENAKLLSQTLIPPMLGLNQRVHHSTGPRSTQNIHNRKSTPQHIELLKLKLNKQSQKTSKPYGKCLIMFILKFKHVTYWKWMSHLFTNRHQRSVLKSAWSTTGTEN